MEIIIIRKKLISMSIIFTSLTVRGQPSPRFHVEAWLLFRNCEMDYFVGPNVQINFLEDHMLCSRYVHVIHEYL